MKSHDEIRGRMQGPCLSLPTVFTREGPIDHQGMRNVIDVALDAGCQIVMLTWGDGLVSLLTDTELAQVHRNVIEHVGDRAVTIGCDNQWALPKALEFGRYVEALGFDLYMVRPADWGAARGTAETLAEHFRALAEVTRVMLVGNVPLRTCELIEDEPNVLAFKEDLAIDYAHEVQMRWGDRWAMVTGGAHKRHVLFHPHGPRAWLDIFIRSHPQPTVDYWNALKRDDTRTAWDIAMRYEQKIWDYVKRVRYGQDGLFAHALLEVYDVAPRWRRSPAPDPTDEELDQLRDMLRGIGLM